MAWLALIIFGGVKLELYSATPGRRATGASVDAGKRFHLYLFLHPLCPCSSATLSELNRLQASVRTPLDVTAVIDNAGFAPHVAAPLLRRLASAPGIAVEVDANGHETASFGARTSGQVLLYNAAGVLEFSGGLTSARGHEGDSAGEAAIIDIVDGRTPVCRATPTFGCALSPVKTKP
ncbi:MAG: RedB protein [Fimbriimonadaceae bacterium]